MKLPPISVFCGLIALLFSLPAVSQSIDDAKKLAEEKKYKEALVIYNKLIQKDSSCYACYNQRGLIYEEMDDMQKSYEDFTKAISIYPDSALAYHYRAILFYRILYTEEAIADNTKALELTDSDEIRKMCFSNRGNAKQQKRDFQGAFEDYSRAYYIDTTDMAALNNMATSMDELGRVDEAIVYLKKIIRIDSTFIGPYVNIGFQYTKSGRYKEALAYFDKALTIEKDNPLALNNRGLVKYYLKDYAGALTDINKSISFYPANAYAFKNRALVHLAKKEKDKACADIQEALDLDFTKVYGDEVLELQKQHCGK